MTEKRYTYLDASRNKYIGSFFCNGKPLTNDEVADLLNEQEERIRELENSKKQLKRVYNYFMDYLEDEMSRNSFSEMWDFVITDEKWD